MPLKVGEIPKLIEADGWYLVVIKGSHRQYKHPSKPGRVTVAGKPSAVLPPGVVAESDGARDREGGQIAGSGQFRDHPA